MSTLKPLTKYEIKLFDLVCQIANANQRCPSDAGLEGKIGKPITISTLASKGWVEIRFYEANYRVVVILRGPHTGKYTKHQDGTNIGSTPARVVNANGDTAQNAMYYRAQPKEDISLGEPFPWDKKK